MGAAAHGTLPVAAQGCAPLAPGNVTNPTNEAEATETGAPTRVSVPIWASKRKGTTLLEPWLAA